MRSMTVIKPDMAVLRRDRLGLSSFGILSALFGEEILQRSRRRPGFWRPASLELLEGPEQKSETGKTGVHLDMTLLLKILKEEQRAARSQEKRENVRTVEKLVERVILREQNQRLQERTQQINIQAGNMGHTICVTRRTPPKAGLELVSGVTSVPPAGGWQPRWRQEYPGFSAAMRKTVQEGSGSILLPDALRRRREQILEETALSAAVERTEELLRRDGLVLREQLKREVTRSVEETLARQRMQLVLHQEPHMDADGETVRLDADSETAEAAGRGEPQTRRGMETEPPCYPGGEKTGRVHRTEEQPGKPRTFCRGDEGRQSDTGAEKKSVVGRERKETADRPRQIAAGETELVYREGREHTRETESASGQSHPINREKEETVKKETGLEGKTGKKSSIQPQQDTSNELIYREGEDRVHEVERTSERSHPVYREGETHQSETVEKEQIFEGRPGAESVVHPQQDTSTELIYCAGEERVHEVESTSERSIPVYREGEARQSERDEKERIPGGRPSAESAAWLQQNPPTELIYCAGGDRQSKEAGDEVRPGRTAEEPHTRPPSGQEGDLTCRSEMPSQQSVIPASAASGGERRLRPAHQSRFTYRESSTQQTAARDIRTLTPGTPEGRTIGLPASRREENPAELSYLPPSQPSSPPAERKKESALPQWAQRLLEKPDTPDPLQSGRTAAAPGQPPPPMERQIQWTAPAAIPREPNITYRAIQPAEPVPPVPHASISDRELRRATEKIYRMIEERLRREMRRSGR